MLCTSLMSNLLCCAWSPRPGMEVIRLASVPRAAGVHAALRACDLAHLFLDVLALMSIAIRTADGSLRLAVLRPVQLFVEASWPGCTPRPGRRRRSHW